MSELKLMNGTVLPLLGLGTWKAEPGEVGAAVGMALELGYRHLDCAPIYGNEAEIGEALEKAFVGGGVKREELWVTSKLWNSFHLPEDVLPAIQRTLEDLRLETLDLLLIHWPVAQRPEVGMNLPARPQDFLGPDEAPLAETWAAMEEAVDAGLCRHIGVSNFTPAKLRAIAAGARIAPACDQVECHPYLAQNDLLAACEELGVLLTAYSPLGSPDRPARVRGAADPILLEEPTVKAIAARRGATPAQVLLAWALARGTSAIPKSVSPTRLKENLAAMEVKLEAADLEELAALDGRQRYISGELWCPPGSPYSLEWLWA